MILMKLTHYRTLITLSLISVITTLLFAYYIQYWEGIMPCPLCLLQRAVDAMLIGLCILTLIFHKKTSTKCIYLFLIILTCFAGLYLAGKQISLSHLPIGTTPSCTITLSNLSDNSLWHKFVQSLTQNTSECSVVTWTFLSLSLATWNFIYYCALLLLQAINFILTIIGLKKCQQKI